MKSFLDFLGLSLLLDRSLTRKWDCWDYVGCHCPTRYGPDFSYASLLRRLGVSHGIELFLGEG